METTLLLVDDHPLFRKGLHLLLEKQPDLRVVGEAGDGQTAIELARELSPDVVVMDITMPNLDGIEATRRIRSESPHTRVVALSIHAEKQFVEKMLRVGAAGYILKDSVPEELVNGIRTVAGGEVFLSGTITDVVVSHYMDLVSGREAPSPTDEMSTGRIITTKLHRPPLTLNLVSRLRVLEQLNGWQQRPLTLISAGAGYGKSTLISNWLDIIDYPSAWLSLDERDDDLVNFLTYFIAAVRTIFPETGQETLTLVQAPTLPPLPVLAASLANELDKIETPFILVLDDYHHLREVAIHDLLNKLLHHPPHPMHLVVVTRRDPPLDLTKLRARGQMTELGDQELRFTVAETAAFLQLVTDSQVTEAAALLLERKIEGWVTGLLLSALSLNNRGDIDRLLRSLPENIHYVTDYLMAEILSIQPPPVRDFLLETAILNRFCVPLADAVLDPGTEALDEPEANSQSILEQLYRDHLFIIPLDDQHHWFRYHHLFQELLLQRLHQTLTPEGIAELHRRAGAWFESQGLNTEAIEHALVTGDVVAAAEMVERHRHAEHEAGQWHTVERWLARLPTEIKQQRPALLLAEAMVAFVRFQLEKIPSLMEQAGALLDNQTAEPSLLGELNFFRGMFLYWQGEAEASGRHLEEALTQVDEKDLHVKSNIELMLCLARHMSGQKELAVQALTNRIRTIDSSKGFALSYLLAGLSFIHLLSGELNQLSTQAQRMQTVTSGMSNDSNDAWSWYLLASAHLHAYDLDEAAHHFAVAAQHRYTLDTRALVDALAGLALAQQLRQQPDDAAETMNRLLEFARETNDPDNLSVAHSCQARLALLRGDLTAAARWARSVNETPVLAALFMWLEVPCLTQARVLIAVGSKESLDQATELLRAIRHVGDACRFTNQTIEVAVLQSLALEKQGRTGEALVALEEAVTLAGPGGWIRPFVELGRPMADLLNQLRQQGVAPDYIDQILAAFPDFGLESKFPTPSQTPKPVLSQVEVSKIQNLIEPLTNRELDVLELLARRLSDKEIAQELVISIQTVKKHNSSIYQKLNVKNRLAAVHQAIDLGILPDVKTAA